MHKITFLQVGQAMNEKIMVEFTGAEFDAILEYQKTLEGATVQTAILNAVNIALDKADKPKM
jgi:hypothetical protein